MEHYLLHSFQLNEQRSEKGAFRTRAPNQHQTQRKGGHLTGKQSTANGRGWILGICFVAATAALLLLQTTGMAKSAGDKKATHQAAFAVYQQKCLSCHDSVADPEKPGRTRDDWHLVVNIMHGYGMDLSDDEGDKIVDLLYALRKGIERDPG